MMNFIRNLNTQHQHIMSIDRKTKEYMLDSLDDDGHPFTSDEQRIKYLKDRFTSEMGWLIERSGELKAMDDWLRGLAIPIVFYNYDIKELAIKLGSLDANATKAQTDVIVYNYWNFMANKTLQLINGYRVPKRGDESSTDE